MPRNRKLDRILCKLHNEADSSSCVDSLMVPLKESPTKPSVLLVAWLGENLDSSCGDKVFVPCTKRAFVAYDWLDYRIPPVNEIIEVRASVKRPSTSKFVNPSGGQDWDTSFVFGGNKKWECDYDDSEFLCHGTGLLKIQSRWRSDIFCSDKPLVINVELW